MSNLKFTETYFGTYFDENGDTFVEETILDKSEETETVLCDFEETNKFKESYLFNNSEIDDLNLNDDFDCDDVQDDDLDYDTNNFIERNISLFECLNEDTADFNLLNLALTNTEQHIKKRKRE